MLQKKKKLLVKILNKLTQAELLIADGQLNSQSHSM